MRRREGWRRSKRCRRGLVINQQNQVFSMRKNQDKNETIRTWTCFPLVHYNLRLTEPSHTEESGPPTHPDPDQTGPGPGPGPVNDLTQFPHTHTLSQRLFKKSSSEMVLKV